MADSFVPLATAGRRESNFYGCCMEKAYERGLNMM